MPDRFKYTRKKEREQEIEIVKPKSEEPYYWKKFVEEGDKLYNGMICNFDKMFEGDTIRYFEIIDGIYRHIDDTEELTELYGDEIQIDLIPWIKKEHEENRLFDKSLWKPFRDQNVLTCMYYGYRKLFQYKHYYFQLAMESYCDCGKKNICDHIQQRFALALYGWKEDHSDMLQPYMDSLIPIDTIMTENDWNYK